MPKQGSKERLHISQERAGSRRKRPDLINQSINQPSNLSQKTSGRIEIEKKKKNHMYTNDLMHSINNTSGKMTNNNPLIPDVPVHPGSVYRPLLKPIRQDMPYLQSSQSSTNIENANSNFDFEENSPFQEGAMSKTFQRPDKSFFQEPKELEGLINKGNLIHKYLSKQTDIDNILEITNERY